jgi:co-chaperonin GroES (HSP10)
MKVKGKILPLRDNVLVSDMNFGMQETASGIVIHSDNGKSSGVKPRWGRVWAVGPDQKEIKVGEWILIEHGRWTRTIEHEQEDNSIIELRMVELKAVMLSADERPSDVDIRQTVGAGSNVNFNIPGM